MMSKSQTLISFIARLGAFLSVLLLLAACSADTQENNTQQASTTTAAGEGNEASSDAEVIDFELMVYQGEDALGGETVQFSEVLDQGKPVVLNFWAGLCPPCRAEMPDFQMVYEKHKGDVLLVGLDVGIFTGLGTSEEGKALLEELNITYPTGTTSKQDVIQAYNVVSMPSTVFITPEGEIHRSWAGLLNEEKMTELVNELIETSEAG